MANRIRKNKYGILTICKEFSEIWLQILIKDFTKKIQFEQFLHKPINVTRELLHLKKDKITIYSQWQNKEIYHHMYYQTKL